MVLRCEATHREFDVIRVRSGGQKLTCTQNFDPHDKLVFSPLQQWFYAHMW